MVKRLVQCAVLLLVGVFLVSCEDLGGGQVVNSAKRKKIQLVVLDPGHYHAALVQKKTYNRVSPLVLVYAPDGPEHRLKPKD